MKPGRRRERPELPPAPLTFAHPLGVPGGEVEGARVLAEAPPEHAVPLFMVLRALHALSLGPDVSRDLFRRRRVEPWLDELVEAAREEVRRDPDPEGMPLLPLLAVLLTDMTSPEHADRDEVSWNCLGVAEWATGRDATETELAFVEAAALVRPSSARHAWVVGKMYRSHGRMREAEYWLKRASRLAVWTGDWEAQARALIALGNLHLEQGSYKKAKTLHSRALRVASRHHLKDLQGMALHDLFVIASVTGHMQQAEELSQRAFEAYGPQHERLPALAYDVAFGWLTQGFFSRALSVLGVLFTHFKEPFRRYQVLASSARAAGALGKRSLFEVAYQDARVLLEQIGPQSSIAAGLVELGRGAASLSDWARATESLQLAIHLAAERDETDVKLLAESLLAAVSQRHVEEIPVRDRGPSAWHEKADGFAREIVRSLQDGMCLEDSGRTDGRGEGFDARLSPPRPNDQAW